MAQYFSAGQYDQEFTPKRLQMYEVPKFSNSKEPKVGQSLSFIANDKGHLESDIARGDSNPFGDYVGTWDLPKKIPGPYHLVKTGRSDKYIENLLEKKRNTDSVICEARTNQKPLNLQ